MSNFPRPAVLRHAARQPSDANWHTLRPDTSAGARYMIAVRIPSLLPLTVFALLSMFSRSPVAILRGLVIRVSVVIVSISSISAKG
jgi:hypothetical protein